MSEKKDTLVFQGRRRKLVEELSASGLFSEKVLKAIGSVPRHLFVQKGLEDLAYKDMPVAIEAGQTISQPSTVAAADTRQLYSSTWERKSSPSKGRKSFSAKPLKT